MKTAVVTGAGRGIGRLIAHGLAGKGLAVLVTDINADWARDTADEIGSMAWSVRQDVRDPASHREVARRASERGTLEVWVNNAGVLRTGPAWALDDEEVRRHVEVNLLGVIWGSRAAVEAMRPSGGHVINLGSISALTPAPGLAVYGATKQAVLGFSASLHGDLQREGTPIKVSTMCPDAIDTDMIGENADVEEASLLFTARKLLAPQDVADAVVALVDRPRLQTVLPLRNALLAHVFRPFPALSLQVLRGFSWLGERNRRKRSESGG